MHVVRFRADKKSSFCLGRCSIDRVGYTRRQLLDEDFGFARLFSTIMFAFNTMTPSSLDFERWR